MLVLRLILPSIVHWTVPTPLPFYTDDFERERIGTIRKNVQSTYISRSGWGRLQAPMKFHKMFKEFARFPSLTARSNTSTAIIHVIAAYFTFPPPSSKASFQRISVYPTSISYQLEPSLQLSVEMIQLMPLKCRIWQQETSERYWWVVCCSLQSIWHQRIMELLKIYTPWKIAPR